MPIDVAAVYGTSVQNYKVLRLTRVVVAQCACVSARNFYGFAAVVRVGHPDDLSDISFRCNLGL